MIDVQQCTLCAFEQEAATSFGSLIQLVRDISHHGLQFGGEAHCLVEHLGGRNGFCTQILGQYEVMEVEHLFQLCFESCRVIEVLYAQGATAHLVFVRWTDTPTCRADLAVALASLTGLVDGDVIRE